MFVLRPSSVRERVLARVRELVDTRELTLSDLALRTSISQPHLSNLINRKRVAHECQIEAIMDALALGPQDLMSAAEIDALRAWARHIADPERKPPLPQRTRSPQRTKPPRPHPWRAWNPAA
jgi:transcriptional regulator with XRE-family HTH domain